MPLLSNTSSPSRVSQAVQMRIITGLMVRDAVLTPALLRNPPPPAPARSCCSAESCGRGCRWRPAVIDACGIPLPGCGAGGSRPRLLLELGLVVLAEDASSVSTYSVSRRRNPVGGAPWRVEPNRPDRGSRRKWVAPYKPARSLPRPHHWKDFLGYEKLFPASQRVSTLLLSILHSQPNIIFGLELLSSRAVVLPSGIRRRHKRDTYLDLQPHVSVDMAGASGCELPAPFSSLPNAASSQDGTDPEPGAFNAAPTSC